MTTKEEKIIGDYETWNMQNVERVAPGVFKRPDRKESFFAGRKAPPDERTEAEKEEAERQATESSKAYEREMKAKGYKLEPVEEIELKNWTGKPPPPAPPSQTPEQARAVEDFLARQARGEVELIHTGSDKDDGVKLVMMDWVPVPDVSFEKLPQAPPTNALMKIGTKALQYDSIAGRATAKRDGLTLYIQNWPKDGRLEITMKRLFDALLLEYNKNGAEDGKITLSLKDYAAKCGLKSIRRTREQVRKDMATLYNISMHYSSKSNRAWDKDFYDMRICISKGIRRGIIEVELHPKLQEWLKQIPIMPCPKQLLQLDVAHYPASYIFGRLFTERKNMNIGKRNEDIVTVKELLGAVTEFIPAKEEIPTERGQLRQRIIEPFERNMNHVADTLPGFTWGYCYSKGKPIKEDPAEIPYSLFETLKIQATWTTYPDQTKRLEKRAKKQARGKGKKGRKGT